MKEIYTEIEIQASDARVWQLLIDFNSFPQWNPFIRQANGKVETGARLTVFIQPSGSGGITFRPTIVKIEPKRELRWLGHFLIPGLFDGEHIFIIKPVSPGRVCFIQREIFTGILVNLFARRLDSDTKRGFQEMNNALKLRAEKTF